MMRPSSATLLVFLVFVSSVSAQVGKTAAQKPLPRRQPPLSVLSYEVAFGDMVFVHGVVNGHAASLLFDTGGRGTLNLRWLRGSGIKAQAGYQASGAGPAMVQASVVSGSIWRIGAAEVTTRAVVVDLTPLEAVFGREVDGIVGIDFLDRYAVELDPTTRQLRIFAASTYLPIAGSAAVPLEFDENGYAGIQAALRFADKQAHGLFMIDTGLNGAVDVYRPFAERNGLPVHPAELEEFSTGVGGHRSYRFERATTFQAGAYELCDPVVAFNDADYTPSARHYAGLIGMEVLQRFVVAFNFPHKRIYLSPLPSIDAPFGYDGSGLRLRAEGARFQRVIVSRVVSGSPGEQAGVKPGDSLLQVDGKDAGTLGLESIRDQFRQPGTAELVLQRNGTEVKAHLVLKPLL